MATNTAKTNLGEFYTNLTTTANNIAQTANTQLNSLVKTAGEAINSAVNAVKNTPQTINSLLPLSNTAKKNNSLFGFFGSNRSKNITPILNNTGSSASTFAWPVVVFIIISILTIVLLVKYKDKILAGIHNLNQKIRDTFNKPTTPLTDASKPPVQYITEPPVPPQYEITQQSDIKRKTSTIFDKMAPIGNPEVFNISKNDFTYYDAEPLCRALGAELATYDQVKEAWSKGADWCNYGWVKGQAAVYPIQDETYQKIQSGPDDERNSCGTVGLNGGFFENPELKFGVNCYGIKPPQSAHDQELLMSQGNLPKSVASLKIDKKVQEFKRHADEVGVLPFNNDKWTSL